MTKPQPGQYLFVHYGYGGPQLAPQLTLLAQGDEEFMSLTPRGETLTLTFDASRRYCTGWHDLATAQSHPCPDRTTLPDAYQQCRRCQVKTGFNPAFYHATTVSDKQQARNQLPHLLYVAHFAPGVIKVGITWAERGIRRLLDQGARSGLIVKTYPSADVARQYEAKAAKLAGIAEAIQLRQKYLLLRRPYDPTAAAAELAAVRDRLVHEVGAQPDDNSPLHLEPYYLGDGNLQPHNLIDLTKGTAISGTCLGMVGSVLVTQQDDMQFALPLSKFAGYRCEVSYCEIPNHSEPHQVSLF